MAVAKVLRRPASAGDWTLTEPAFGLADVAGVVAQAEDRDTPKYRRCGAPATKRYGDLFRCDECNRCDAPRVR